MREELRVVRPFGAVVVNRYPAGLRMTRHGHDFDGLSVVLAGSLIEEVGHVRVHARAGSLVLKPRATLHANDFGPSGARLLSLTFEKPCDGFGMSDRFAWRWSRGVTVMRAAVCLLAGVKHTTPTSPSVERAVDEMITELIAAATPDRPSARLPPPWLGDVRAYLDEARVEGMSVLDLAAGVSVHPVYLARRFRQAYGCSISHYRRRARVLAAVSSISSSKRTFTEVAAARGFSDHSHFSRECRDTLGMTPTELRALLS